MSPTLPSSAAVATAAIAPESEMRAHAVVLRDVIVRGQVALARPGSRAGTGSPPAPLQGLSGAFSSASMDRSAGPEAEARDSEAAARPASRGSAPDAWADLAQVEEEARQRGYEEGFAKGRIEGRARGDEEARGLAAQAAEKAARDLQAHAERMTHDLQQQAEAGYQARVRVLDDLIAGLPPKIEARLAAAEDDMLALCFDVVCRMLGESVARPAALRSQLAQAMDGLRSRKLVAVHMHPDDLTVLQKLVRAEQGLPAGLGGAEVQWVASADVALGGCVLQSPEGGLDARFETQLVALRQLLLQTRAATGDTEA